MAAQREPADHDEIEQRDEHHGDVAEVSTANAPIIPRSYEEYSGVTGVAASATAQADVARSTLSHYHVPASAETVHWGYFSKKLNPVIEINSGDFVTLEIITHHAGDDLERMVLGDKGVESIYYWDKTKQGVNRRGAGPEDASLFGRGAGEGLGVHICTGPVAVRGAAVGDILEVRILDVKPRPAAKFPGKSFGSNAARPIRAVRDLQDVFGRPRAARRFRKMRHFLMTTQGLSEDEAISLMSVAVDFGITQVVDGNWGVHAVLKKNIFTGA